MPWLEDWPSWWSWHRDPYACLDSGRNTMNDAFRADALTLAIEAEVEDLLLVMLRTDLIARNARHQGRVCTAPSTSVGVFSHGLPLVALALARLVRRHHLRLRNCPLWTIVWSSRLCIVPCSRSLCHRNELLQLRNAFCVECCAFVAYFADDALDEGKVHLHFSSFSSRRPASTKRNRDRDRDCRPASIYPRVVSCISCRVVVDPSLQK